MKIIVRYFPLLFLAFLFFIAMGESCTQSTIVVNSSDSLLVRKNLPASPVLSAEESIKKMHIEDGFTVKLVAAEPLVIAPVAMSFDSKGRLWVVEMEDYMPDTLGTGEDNPSGRIIILTDTNGDGVMDERKVFLDSLILPRAICLIENGILVAEPPNLWYYKIENDQPVRRTLVDSAFAVGGNAEHQPNALFRAMDNWIYCAEGPKRYRKCDEKWIIEKSHFRGQWGLTDDEQGRLYYNNNSENLLGDYFSPGFGTYNKNQKTVAGFNESIVPDTKVFPARPTPGVNRGYSKGILDDSLRLVNFTAACGPVIFKSNLFGNDYKGNAFVAEPSANLIKRNILKEEGYSTSGKLAYDDKEFLASDDERFRPVSLYNGPDGALYIVDMYRGIIQHKTYLTPYLKNEIKERKLSKPLSCGRIYKVVPTNKKLESIKFLNDPKQLVELLQNSNGWIRSKAQQLLVDTKNKDVAPLLRNLLKDTTKSFAVIHSLWTMEGLNILQSNDVLPLIKQKNWIIRMQALSMLPSILNKENYRQFIPLLQEMINSNDTLAAPYIGFLAHWFLPLNESTVRQLLISLAKKYPDNRYVVDAIINNFQDKETEWKKEFLHLLPDTNLLINVRLRKLIEEKHKSVNKAEAA
ncbi:MAG: dehydrogenase, partial [Ginsengibacter sp.]